MHLLLAGGAGRRPSSSSSSDARGGEKWCVPVSRDDVSLAEAQQQRAVGLDLFLELEQAVEERLGRRRAARDVDVDRDDAVDAAHDGVRVVVVSAAVGAAAHREHEARLGHLVVDLAERGRHLVGERAGDDHDVGLPRRRAEHHAEALHVVPRGRRVHHLHRAAREPERHRPQRPAPRPVHELVHLGHHVLDAVVRLGQHVVDLPRLDGGARRRRQRRRCRDPPGTAERRRRRRRPENARRHAGTRRRRDAGRGRTDEPKHLC
mmetsp:Transcript_19324/g.76950  ORF Transcript_19324/g.76950 Transcript_19324/m.76950 type:complete len:263 (-) Transcript_19324:36-824(-)